MALALRVTSTIRNAPGLAPTSSTAMAILWPLSVVMVTAPAHVNSTTPALSVGNAQQVTPITPPVLEFVPTRWIAILIPSLFPDSSRVATAPVGTAGLDPHATTARRSTTGPRIVGLAPVASESFQRIRNVTLLAPRPATALTMPSVFQVIKYSSATAAVEINGAARVAPHASPTTAAEMTVVAVPLATSTIHNAHVLVQIT